MEAGGLRPLYTLLVQAGRKRPGRSGNSAIRVMAQGARQLLRGALCAHNTDLHSATHPSQAWQMGSRRLSVWYTWTAVRHRVGTRQEDGALAQRLAVACGMPLGKKLAGRL